MDVLEVWQNPYGCKISLNIDIYYNICYNTYVKRGLFIHFAGT